MIRRHLVFECEGASLAATLDMPDGDGAGTGLLIVSGGNEIRSGVGGASARMAARIAGAGYPVLRFDRRGVGDSEGMNFGFQGAEPDITEALATFRKQAKVSRVVGFGNCDAASALMLMAGAGTDALVLANPWTIEDPASGAMPVAAMRAHYRRRMMSPAALWRLVTGGVSLRRLARGLAGAARPVAGPGELALDIATGLASFAGPSRLLLAGRDRTADAFLANWDRNDPRLFHCPAAGHAFIETEAAAWLEAQLLEMLGG